MTRHIHNAILLPIAPDGRILIQDGRGHRPPPWGFFGGGIEPGETSLEAVIREAREELELELTVDDLEQPRNIEGSLGDLTFHLQVFVWQFNGDISQLRVLEGAGAELMTPQEMLQRVETGGPDFFIAELAANFRTGLE